MYCVNILLQCSVQHMLSVLCAGMMSADSRDMLPLCSGVDVFTCCVGTSPSDALREYVASS